MGRSSPGAAEFSSLSSAASLANKERLCNHISSVLLLVHQCPGSPPLLTSKTHCAMRTLNWYPRLNLSAKRRHWHSQANGLGFKAYLTTSPTTSQLEGKREDQARSERAIIEAALAGSKGRISGPTGAAARLGIPASTLDHRIKALKIDKKKFKFG